MFCSAFAAAFRTALVSLNTCHTQHTNPRERQPGIDLTSILPTPLATFGAPTFRRTHSIIIHLSVIIINNADTLSFHAYSVRILLTYFVTQLLWRAHARKWPMLGRWGWFCLLCLSIVRFMVYVQKWQACRAKCFVVLLFMDLGAGQSKKIPRRDYSPTKCAQTKSEH